MGDHNEHAAPASPSRRALLASSAGIMAGAAAAQMLPSLARAQGAGAGDAELARVQGSHRILIKGGLVLTLDRDVGDFLKGDVLIENGKIRDLRPDIAVSSDDTAVIDATSRIVLPGF